MTDEDMEQFERMLGQRPGKPELVVLSSEQLLKRFVWDVSPCQIAKQVVEHLGLTKASEEVEDMEHREAHVRLNGAGPIEPVVKAFSGFTAQVIQGAMIVEHGADSETEAEMQEHLLQVQAVVYQSAISIIAELLDIGLLKMPNIARESQP